MHINDPKSATLYEAYPVTFTTLQETLVKRPILLNTIYITPKKSFDIWWLNRANTAKGRSLHQWSANITITTDASKTGIRGRMKGQIFQGKRTSMF